MKTLKQLIVLIAFLAMTTALSAQPGSATLSAKGALVLSSDQPLQSQYALDASNFNFTTNQDAIDYFASKNSEYVSFRPSLQNNIILIYLQVKQRPDWTKADWNAHFKEHLLKDNSVDASQELTK